MQHLRWNSLCQKIGNGWKLLLTVVTQNFVLNETGLLNLTLKLIDKFIPSGIQMFKVSKKTHWNKSNMFKVNNKDTRTTLSASIVNFEHSLQFIPLLLLLNNCEKYIVLSAVEMLLGCIFSSLFTQYKVLKRINFHNSTSKKVEPCTIAQVNY